MLSIDSNEASEQLPRLKQEAVARKEEIKICETRKKKWHWLNSKKFCWVGLRSLAGQLERERFTAVQSEYEHLYPRVLFGPYSVRSPLQ